MSLILALAATIVPAGTAFPCTPVAVWDGDGPVWCREGPHIRLSGIAAREMDGSCSDGHPCPSSSPEAARDALVRLVGSAADAGEQGHVLVEGPTMRCVSEGSAGGSRTAAWCVSPIGEDLSCAMVLGGWAARWDRYWKGHDCS